MVNETPPAGLLKGDMFLRVLIETFSYKDTTGVPIENEDNYRARGGIQRGTGVPLCVVAGVGYIGEGPHRKGPAPMRAFAYFSHEGKVGPGLGREGPGATK